MFFKQFKRPAGRILQSMLLCTSLAAQAENRLPDIGTAGVAALSIDKEVTYGDSFMRFARASLPIIDDPVLDEYVTDLGQRLLSKANDVRFPFSFALVKDDSINAAAFLGGKVKVHTGLFLYADTESELASVLAHEITHVTQRHIARYMEAQAQQSPLAIAGLVGSIALAMINPTAGVAALQTTMGLQIQSAINYTRDNEYEADRIGMQLLYDAGFDPMGMADFFQKLAATYRYASKPPEMLLTHPLPETRIADARTRAANFPPRVLDTTPNFAFAKARIQVRYGPESAEALLTQYDGLLARNQAQSRDGARYGKVLALMKLQRNEEAAPLLAELAEAYPDSLFILDTQTDLDLAGKRYAASIARLTQRQQSMPDNDVVLFNLANSHMEAGQPQEAAGLLDRYVRNHPDSDLAWHMLTQAYQQTGDATNLYLAQAEYSALRGDFQQAIEMLNRARATSNDKLVLARIDARITQLDEAKRQDESLKR